MTNITHTQEHTHTINGVQGRMHNRILDTSTGLFRNQRFTATRPITGWGAGAQITVEVRFDDQCKNGKQSFAVTAEIKRPGRRDVEACGCLHDEIVQVFPELASLIRWHLFDTAGPMHYVANTCYHASNLDHYGRAAGEPCAWEHGVRFDDVPVTFTVGAKLFEFLKERKGSGELQVVGFAHDREPETYKPHYSFVGFGQKWHEAPYRSKVEAEELCEALNRCRVEFVKIPTEYSKGKTRDLNAARSCAAWSDATDEQLCAPRAELEAALLARLPALLAAFRADMDACGLLWEQGAA
jgi:hypothetical protein